MKIVFLHHKKVISQTTTQNPHNLQLNLTFKVTILQSLPIRNIHIFLSFQTGFFLYFFLTNFLYKNVPTEPVNI